MDSLLRARLSELANRAYNNTQYTFTNFLSEAELSEYIEMSKELAFIPSETFGGMDASERQIIRFGGKDIRHCLGGKAFCVSPGRIVFYFVRSVIGKM